MLPLPRPHQHHRRHSSNSSAVAKERRPSGTGGAPRPRLTPSPSESANDDGWNQRHHHEHGRRTSASKESSSHYNDADSGNKHKADQKAAYLAPPSSVSSRRNRSPARLPSSRDQHAYRHAFPEIHNSSSSNSNAGAPARRPSLMAPIPTIELTASPRDRDRDHRGRDEHEYPPLLVAPYFAGQPRRQRDVPPQLQAHVCYCRRRLRQEGARVGGAAAAAAVGAPPIFSRGDGGLRRWSAVSHLCGWQQPRLPTSLGLSVQPLRSGRELCPPPSSQARSLVASPRLSGRGGI